MTSRRDILLPLLWLAFCSSFCGFFLANVALAKAGGEPHGVVHRRLDCEPRMTRFPVRVLYL